MIVLETERLLLRDHEPQDREPYCEIESDPEYRRPQPVHPRAELERSFRETWLPPKAMGLLATVFKPDGHYIGRCGLYPFRNPVVLGRGKRLFDDNAQASAFTLANSTSAASGVLITRYVRSGDVRTGTFEEI